MAREHARLLVSTWDDPDIRALTQAQQAVYFQHVSHRDLSRCGVMPFLPERLIPLSKDATRAGIARSVAELERRRFLVVDRDTAEVLVRTYIRHDRLLKVPNVTKAMVRAISQVHSRKIVTAIEREIVALLRDEPDMPGWPAFGQVDPERFTRLFARAYPNSKPNSSANSSAN